MKHKIKIFVISIFIILINCVSIKSAAYKNGYSEWSPEKSGVPNEVSTIQYGRKLPLEWSNWSEVIPNSLDVRSKKGMNKWYIEGSGIYWNNVNAKSVYTWNFTVPKKVLYAYIDVDTYNSNEDFKTYEGPPLQLYCDGRKIAEIGKHNVLENWELDLDTSCTYMELKMSANPGEGRNMTAIVGTWVGTETTLYSYVTKWDEGNDWRFDKEYKRVYGENPEMPTERTVYSHPINYRINYELDGGEFVGEPKYTYTVLEEFYIPRAYKKGYEFIGFYNQKGNRLNYVNKGTYGDLYLTARYNRKPPSIYIGYTYFRVDEENNKIYPKDIIKSVSGKALDELDGTISDRIVVRNITYESKNKSVDNPAYLEVDREDVVYITFSVTNSGGLTASVKRKFYILGQGEVADDYIDNIKIYSRYIDKEYIDTLSDNSIWKTDDYLRTLLNALN